MTLNDSVSLHEAQETPRCECGMAHRRICGQPFQQDPDEDMEWCINTRPDGRQCGHDEACHAPAKPLPATVTISLEDAKAIAAHLHLVRRSKEPFAERLRAAIAEVSK